MTTAAELRASVNYSARHRAAGRCVNCPRDARPGRVMCQPCADRKRERDAARAARGGERLRAVHCSRCGATDHNRQTCERDAAFAGGWR